MKTIFISHDSKFQKNAYSYRIDKFKSHIFKYGECEIDSIYLKSLVFGTPSLIQPLNIAFLLNRINKCDVIYAGNTPVAYTLGLWKRKIKGIIVYDVHGDIVQEFYLSRKYKIDPLNSYVIMQSKIMEWIAQMTADYFITCSEPLKQHYIKKGIDPDRIEVIRNGVDLDLFKPLETKFEDEKFVVTYAGGFQKWQGIENLIDAAKLLHNSDIKFKIIGFAKSDQRFKNKIATELGNSVDLIDVLPREELIAHLHSSDILIIPRNRHPAIEVALPTKFAEYIAMGKPVIVTGVDETADFVQKYDCAGCPKNNFHDTLKF